MTSTSPDRGWSMVQPSGSPKLSPQPFPDTPGRGSCSSVSGQQPARDLPGVWGCPQRLRSGVKAHSPGTDAHDGASSAGGHRPLLCAARYVSSDEDQRDVVHRPADA